MKEKIVAWIKTNYLPLLFIVAAVFIELTAIAVTSGAFYIRNPWMYLTVLGLLTLVQFFIPSNKARYIYSIVTLSVIFIMDLVFIVIFELTETIFDFSMFNLRGDAMAIVEEIPVNFVYGTVSGVLLSSFIVFARLPLGKVAEPTTHRLKKIIVPSLLAVIIALHTVCVFFSVRTNEADPYLTEKLYGSADASYADRSPIGNLVTEIYQGAFSKTEMGDSSDVTDFIYKEVETGENDPMFGVAKDYNVVTILGETFEWFSFMRDDAKYPNGHNISEDILRELYPNLYKFYDSSYVFNNFYAREKTDISENLSIIGSYPLDYLLNYDYPENNIEYSLPNTFKTLYGEDTQVISFHNGNRTYYNRNKYLVDAVGFEKFVAAEDMEALPGDDFTDHIPEGERNLDSEMIKACKDEMFPSDKRFYTYITTISMHGKFSHRESMARHYEKLDAKGVYPLVGEEELNFEEKNAFRYYAAATMELDDALGMVMDELKNRGLEDNTMVVIFGDHNAYYQSLTNYVKNIYPITQKYENVTELYRVPLMIRIGEGLSQAEVIEKFTYTADIPPTIMSLLGIKYYSNLFYGHSVFSAEESLLYSRAYDVFLTDKIYFTTLKNIKYSHESVNDAYINDIESRALTLLKKISYINRLFAGNYFTGENATLYETKLKSLNGIQ